MAVQKLSFFTPADQLALLRRKHLELILALLNSTPETEKAIEWEMVKVSLEMQALERSTDFLREEVN